jgi:hypothetical protein
MLAINFRGPETQGRHTSSHCTVELGRISLKELKREERLTDLASHLDQEAMRTPACLLFLSADAGQRTESLVG